MAGLQYTSNEVDHVLVVSIRNPALGAENARQLADLLRMELAAGSNRIILDLTAVDQIADSILPIILNGHRRACRNKGDLKIVSPNKRISVRMLALGGGKPLAIHPSVNAAIDAFF